MQSSSTPQTPLMNDNKQASVPAQVVVNINEPILEDEENITNAKTDLAPTILYGYRWFVLAVFSFVSFGNAAVWITFAPISGLFLQFFQQPSMLSIDALSLVYMIAYIPGVIFASMLLSKRGLRVALIVGGGLTVLGAWIRYIGVLGFMPVHGRFPTVLIGQILAAIAQAFILQVPPLISNNWFGPTERSMATSIGSLANQLGVAAGFLISSYSTQTEQQIPTLMLIFAVICSASYVFCVFGIRDKPPTPPSTAAAHRLDAQLTMKQSLAFLVNRDFILLLICFGINIGIFYALGTVIAAALEPFGFTPAESGIIGFVMTAIGIAGAIVAGIITDKLKRYKPITIVVNVGCCVALVWMALVASPKQYISMCIAAAVFGFFVTAAIPSNFEAAVEYGFPVSEDLSGGLLMASAQVVGIILLLSMNQLIRVEKHIGAMWLAVGASGLTVFLSLFLTTNYKRMQIEQAARGSTSYNTLTPASESSNTTDDKSSVSKTSTTNATPHSEDSDTVSLDDGLPSIITTFHSTPNTPASFRRLAPELEPLKVHSAPSSPLASYSASDRKQPSPDRLRTEPQPSPIPEEHVESVID